MSTAVRIVIGLACAAIAQFVGLLLGGAGHGWVTPFFASAALWVLLPIGFVFATPSTGYAASRKPMLIALAVIAVIANVGLIFTTIDQGTEYFSKVFQLSPPFVLGWMALWISWQIGIIWTLAAGPRDHETFD